MEQLKICPPYTRGKPALCRRYTPLSAIGVDSNSIKIIDKAHVGEKKLRFLTADEAKINELLSKIDTISKDEVNKAVLYTVKTTFKDVPKEKWTDQHKVQILFLF